MGQQREALRREVVCEIRRIVGELTPERDEQADEHCPGLFYELREGDFINYRDHDLADILDYLYTMEDGSIHMATNVGAVPPLA